MYITQLHTVYNTASLIHQFISSSIRISMDHAYVIGKFSAVPLHCMTCRLSTDLHYIHFNVTILSFWDIENVHRLLHLQFHQSRCEEDTNKYKNIRGLYWIEHPCGGILCHNTYMIKRGKYVSNNSRLGYLDILTFSHF